MLSCISGSVVMWCKSTKIVPAWEYPANMSHKLLLLWQCIRHACEYQKVRKRQGNQLCSNCFTIPIPECSENLLWIGRLGMICNLSLPMQISTGQYFACFSKLASGSCLDTSENEVPFWMTVDKFIFPMCPLSYQLHNVWTHPYSSDKLLVLACHGTA